VKRDPPRVGHVEDWREEEFLQDVLRKARIKESTRKIKMMVGE
jgi:AMMECR1 domain-containing protein